jgi:ParB-like chromosome segregation protein Spo0J
MPPIVFDPIQNSIIDGTHRANAYAKLGYDTIPAYIGSVKSEHYGESGESEEDY